MKPDITYEELRAELVCLEAPSINGDRRIYWVLSRKLGIARTFDSSIELFIVGERIFPRTATVKKHLEYACWLITDTSENLEASRLILPSAPHFTAVATMIAVELCRAGLTSERALQDVMDDTEPIIEMALRRGALSESYQVGLLGELLCLEAMLDAVVRYPEFRMAVLDMWQGHRQGSHDFTIGETIIEVKTTQHNTSSHKISGLHQVEPESNGELYMLSVGLSSSETEGMTLPNVVQRIVNRLTDYTVDSSGFSPLQRRFLEDVARYGSTSSRGYEHVEMSRWPVYSTRFRSTFTPRLYDLRDPDVHLIRRDDLEGTHVSPNDIQYRIDLGVKINAINPSPSWQLAVAGFVKNALGLECLDP